MKYLRLLSMALITVLITVLLGLVLAACGEDEEKTPKVVNHADQTRFKLGDAAPAFTLPTADGGTVSLADYEGEDVLLFFHMAVG
jgi:peroxiredoxin Q/BCP